MSERAALARLAELAVLARLAAFALLARDYPCLPLKGAAGPGKRGGQSGKRRKLSSELDYSAGRTPSTFGTAMAEALEEGRVQIRNGGGAGHGFKQILTRNGGSGKWTAQAHRHACIPPRKSAVYL